MLEPSSASAAWSRTARCSASGPRLREGSSAAGTQIGPLVIGDGVTVCCGAVVYAGARRGRTGDHRRPGSGARGRQRSARGRWSGEHRASISGPGSATRVLIQTGVYVTGGSVVEDDVFLGPGVITTNDHAMGRHARGEPLLGPIFRRACRVGGGAVLVPGVVIGEEAFVAAGALVTRDVGDRDVVMGVPARVVRRVSRRGPDRALELTAPSSPRRPRRPARVRAPGSSAGRGWSGPARRSPAASRPQARSGAIAFCRWSGVR